MPKKRRISKKKLDALQELLDRILDELPGPIYVSDDSEDEEDESYFDSLDVEVENVEVVVDTALSEMVTAGVLPELDGDYYTLASAFEVILGEESDFAEMAGELETLLSGYQDFIRPDDVEVAKSIIEKLKEKIDALTK